MLQTNNCKQTAENIGHDIETDFGTDGHHVRRSVVYYFL